MFKFHQELTSGREIAFLSLVPASLSVQGAPCIRYSKGLPTQYYLGVHSQFALDHPSFSLATVNARGTPRSLTKWPRVPNINTTLLLLNSNTNECSLYRGYTQDLGGAGVHEWKRSGPTGCWVHLGVQTEGQSIRKPSAELGWVAGWEQRVLSSPSVRRFGGQARRCPMSHQSHIPLEAEGGVR